MHMSNSMSQSLLAETDTSLIRAELERLLSDRRFSGARQMSAFLRYIVSETLDGNGNRIKAYTVGVDALGKADDFDAQSDPSVRVLALRLRKSLEAAYADEPECHARIVMTVGSYVPEFYKPHAFVSNDRDTEEFQDGANTAVANTARVMSGDKTSTSLHNDSRNDSNSSKRRLSAFDENTRQSRFENSHRHDGRPETGEANVARMSIAPDSRTSRLRDQSGVMMAVALLAAAWQVSVNSANAATPLVEGASQGSDAVTSSRVEPRAGNPLTCLPTEIVALTNCS